MSCFPVPQIHTKTKCYKSSSLGQPQHSIGQRAWHYWSQPFPFVSPWSLLKFSTSFKDKQDTLSLWWIFSVAVTTITSIRRRNYLIGLEWWGGLVNNEETVNNPQSKWQYPSLTIWLICSNESLKNRIFNVLQFLVSGQIKILRHVWFYFPQPGSCLTSIRSDVYLIKLICNWSNSWEIFLQSFKNFKSQGEAKLLIFQHLRGEKRLGERESEVSKTFYRLRYDILPARNLAEFWCHPSIMPSSDHWRR